MGGACRVVRLHREDGSRLWDRARLRMRCRADGGLGMFSKRLAGMVRSAQVRSGKRRAPVGLSRRTRRSCCSWGVPVRSRQGWGRRRGAGEPRDGRCGGYRRARLLFDAFAAHGPGGSCGREAHRAQARIRQARAPRSVVLRARVHERGRAGERRGHRAAGELRRFITCPSCSIRSWRRSPCSPVSLPLCFPAAVAFWPACRSPYPSIVAVWKIAKLRWARTETPTPIWARRSSRTCRGLTTLKSTASTPIATRR